ncbi:MAG: hypothetical protein EP329_01310 [Deltaproteobacteria bacterium]|nr:MAG: hypothetical protein EP329_01310 [Deltaproteobacteria bacterium]
MAGSKIIAPVALAVAALGVVVILVQNTTISGLEDRVVAQEKALAKLAGMRSEVNKPAPVPEEPPAPAVAVDLSTVESRLAAVEREARSAAVLARAASAKGPTDDDEDYDDGALVSLADDIASLRTDVDALLTGRGLETPEAKEAMRAAVDEARVARQAERQARRTEQRQARLDDFIAKANLSETQASSLRAAVDAQREARQAMREAVQSGEKTWEEAREDMRAARRAFEKQLDEILDEEQRAAFDESQGGRGGRGGFGGGGRGDFGGARGDGRGGRGGRGGR